MRAQAAWPAERTPPRSRLTSPAGVFGRGQLAAALATAALVAQLLFAQFTLAVAGCLIIVGSATRWRPHWLAVPALAGLVWTLAVGPAAALAGFAALPGRLGGYLTGAVGRPGQLTRASHAVAAAGPLLPRQLPVAMLAGAAEAALVLWACRWRGYRAGQRPGWRPGLVALVRLRWNAASLAAGHCVTADGFALGVDQATGGLAGISWAQAEHGVLVTGEDGQVVSELGLAVACAAMRRRKTVVLVDLGSGLTGEPAVTAVVAALARSLGGPARTLVAPESADTAIGVAIRRRRVLLVPSHDASHASALQGIAKLAEVLATLRGHGLRGDCLAWISGCDAVPLDMLASLVRLGPVTGTAVLLSTTPRGDPASLEQLVGVVVRAAADAAGEFSLTACGRPAALTCRAVPMTRVVSGRPA